MSYWTNDVILLSVNNVLTSLPKPFFVLAPMDDVTDTAFRQVIIACSKPDLLISEFVNVDGLQSPGRDKLMPRLKFSAKEQPIFAQIWGKVPNNYYKTAKELAKMGFAGIDINMGCPDKAVVKNGCGSAMINNRQLAQEIITATKEGANNKIPVSVKIRTGFNEVDFSWPEYLLQQNINMLTVHGRTTKEMSKVPARWEDIAKVREIRDAVSPSTLVVGNGDINSREQGEEQASKYKLDGIMIGRGIFSNPCIFAKADKWETTLPQNKIDLFIKHLELFNKNYPDNSRNPQIMKKFAKVYLSGFEEAKALRTEFMKSQTLTDMINFLSQQQ